MAAYQCDLPNKTYLSYHRGCTKMSNTIGTTCEAGFAYCSGPPRTTPVYGGVIVAQYLVLGVVFLWTIACLLVFFIFSNGVVSWVLMSFRYLSSLFYLNLRNIYNNLRKLLISFVFVSTLCFEPEAKVVNRFLFKLVNQTKKEKTARSMPEL